MKKLICVLTFIALLATSSMVGAVAGTITSAVLGGSYIEVVWTGEAGSGYIEVKDSFGADVDRFDFYVVLVTTYPVGTPTPDYDVTLIDESGVDLMGSELLNRHTSNSEQAVPYIGGGYGPRKVAGKLLVTVANQAEGAATVTIRIYFD